MLMLIIILPLALKSFAPEHRTIILTSAIKEQPYEAIFKAVCVTESNFDADAYNSKENAVGIAQIRSIRIRDYNQRTGDNFTLSQMFDPDKAKIVFMYYACKFHPSDYEKIARSWNGSGPMTEIYWNKVKVML